MSFHPVIVVPPLYDTKSSALPRYLDAVDELDVAPPKVYVLLQVDWQTPQAILCKNPCGVRRFQGV